MQLGAYLSRVDNKELQTNKMNYPAPGVTEPVFGLQLGGVCFTIEEDEEGVQHLSNVKVLMVLGKDAESFPCDAGTIHIMPGCCKMFGLPAAVWGMMSGPATTSVKNHTNPDVMQMAKKKLPSTSKEMEVTLPNGSTVTGFVGRHLTKHIFKTGTGISLLRLMADGKSLECLVDGQKNLFKLLTVAGLEVSLDFGKTSIPEKPESVFLNMFVQHKDINDGNRIMLFTIPPIAQRPPHILQPGVFPGNKSLKDMMDLPWTFELRGVLEKLVKPLVDFAVDLETASISSKWKKDPRDLSPLILAMGKMHKAGDKERLMYALSRVKTRVNVVDGAWGTNGLLVDMSDRLKQMINARDPSVVELDDSEDEDDEDEEMEELNVGSEKGGKRPLAKGSPAKSSTRSSSGSSAGSEKKAAKAAKRAKEAKAAKRAKAAGGGEKRNIGMKVNAEHEENDLYSDDEDSAEE